MSQNRPGEDDQDPAPLQHTDAERVPAGGDAEAAAESDEERSNAEDDEDDA